MIMYTAFQCKFDHCGAICSSSFSLCKHESFCQYCNGLEFKLNDAYLSLWFSGVDGPDIPVPAKEDTSHTDDDFEFEFDALEYTPTDKDIGVKKLSSSSAGSLGIGYAVDIIVRVSKETLKSLAYKLLTFFYAPTLNAKKYKTKLPFLSKYKSILIKIVRGNLAGLNLNSLFVAFQSQHVLEMKNEFFVKNSVKVLKEQIFLAHAQHKITRPKLLDSKK